MDNEKTTPNNELTLDDLINDNSDKVPASNTPPQYGAVNIANVSQTTSINEIKKNAEAEVANQILNDGVLPKLQEIRKNAEQIKDSIIQNEIAQDELAEFNEINDGGNPNITLTTNPDADLLSDDDDDLTPTDSNNTYSFNDKDLEALEKELEDRPIDDFNDTDDFSPEVLESLKQDIQKYIHPINKPIDLDQFTVATDSSISASKAVMIATQSAANRNTSAADWVLLDTGRVISMRPFDSNDIDKLNGSYRNRANTLRVTWQTIYDHCADENKPSTMEAWLKTISVSDIEHIYGAIFKASFAGNSYIPIECKEPDCRNTFIPGETPFEDFISYNTPECKAYVQSIMDRNTLTGEFSETKKIQVTDDIVVELCKPSIYSMIFENIGLDDATRRKFEDLLNILSYTKNIYYIDRQINKLVPVKPKVFPGDQVKSIKAKILAYGKIFMTFTSDQAGLINGMINSLITDSKYKITYKYPTAECPKCHHSAGGGETDPATMLFTRHKLTALVN